MTRYDFSFPAELIARAPASPRWSARLLIHDRKTRRTEWDVFRNIGKYLPPRSVLVLNETKVLPARLVLRKATGGRVRALYLATEGKDIRVMADRPVREGESLVLEAKLSFRVGKRDGKYLLLRPSFPVRRLAAVLAAHGTTPIPPYIKNPPLSEARLRREYQTVFARRAGSVAAPTAALHFTPALLHSLRRAGHAVRFLTLHVNLGTFAPLTEEALRTGKLHREFYEIPAGTAAYLNRARAAGRPIVAVGTTVVRALESAADAKGRLRKLSGGTDIFIRPPYRFRFADRLITNFHVPDSSLLMLVSAFASRRTVLGLYRQAVKKRFRLFSFGDAMFLR